MYEPYSAPVKGSDTDPAAKRHLALTTRFQAMSDGLLSGIVRFQRYPVIWYEQRTEEDDIGRTAMATDEDEELKDAQTEDFSVTREPILGFVPSPGSSDHHPKMHRSLETFDPDPESIRLRIELQEAMSKVLGASKPSQGRSKPLVNGRLDSILVAHFGLAGDGMQEIEQIAQVGGTQTPATVRYFIREGLKRLLPDPAAQEYLDYLDSQ